MVQFQKAGGCFMWSLSWWLVQVQLPNPPLMLLHVTGLGLQERLLKARVTSHPTFTIGVMMSHSHRPLLLSRPPKRDLNMPPACRPVVPTRSAGKRWARKAPNPPSSSKGPPARAHPLGFLLWMCQAPARSPQTRAFFDSPDMSGCMRATVPK